MKQVVAPVISNKEVTPGFYLMWLDSAEIAATSKPGQFVMVGCGEDTLLHRPISVHQVDAGKIALLFAAVGKGTSWLSQCRAGDEIDLFGPLGNGFSIYSASQNLLLVAGGIGIAPLRFLVDEALRKGCSVTLLLGAQTAARLYPQGLLPPKIKLVAATDDGTAGQKGMITDLIPKYIDSADQIFACGPAGMYRAMAQMPELRSKSVQVSLEVRMGCGRGICYGCTVKTRQGLKQVCQDGPVFDLDDIIWDKVSLTET
ncbi:dihydroorotate dehydrogenase electron transfer subunit [Chloroflexota bacterium]